PGPRNCRGCATTWSAGGNGTHGRRYIRLALGDERESINQLLSHALQNCHSPLTRKCPTPFTASQLFSALRRRPARRPPRNSRPFTSNSRGASRVTNSL